jgi:hypothetical protein
VNGSPQRPRHVSARSWGILITRIHASNAGGLIAAAAGKAREHVYCRRCLADSAARRAWAPFLSGPAASKGHRETRAVGAGGHVAGADRERAGREASHVGSDAWSSGLGWPDDGAAEWQLASAAAAHARSHGGTGAAGAMWGWFRSGVALASPWRRDARTRWRASATWWLLRRCQPCM